MARVPRTSGSRTALEVAAATQRVIDKVRPATPSPEDSRRIGAVLTDLATIMRGSKELQAYQLEEVIEHVAGLAGLSDNYVRQIGLLPGDPDEGVVSEGASGEGES